MKFSCKLCWGISLVLAAALMFGAYTFLVKGATEEAQDGRTTVLLSEAERNKVLGEMRTLLETTQTLLNAIVENDMETFETSARAVGMAATKNESAAMIAKLPLDFKTLGFSAHQTFDFLADVAATHPEPMVLLGQVSEALLVCTTCHASYRLGIEKK